jgi:uncharacterized protein
MQFVCVLTGFSFLQACTTFNVTQKAVIKPLVEPAGAPSTASAFSNLATKPEIVRLPREADVSLHMVWLAQPNASHTMLYFGGNQTRVNENGPGVAQRSLPLGVNLLLIDYRGSGLSNGIPDIDNLNSDALAAYDYLVQERDIAPETIIVQGHSLGSFLAGTVAAKRKIGALVLSGSATTTQAWAKALVPWYFKPIVRIKIAPEMQGRGNLDVVQTQSAPLLIIVGSKDRQAPPHLSKALAREANAAGKSATLLVVKGASHDQAPKSPEAMSAIATLLQQLRAKS